VLDSPIKQGLVLFGTLLAVLLLLEYLSWTNMGYAWAVMFTVVFGVVWTVINVVVRRRGK